MTLIDSNPKLKIGENAPHFTLKGVDREMHSLNELRGANASLIIFMCNHCPYVKAKLETIKILTSKYSDKGLAVIGINLNGSDNYPEDSYENMVRIARRKEFRFHYLRDATQDIAKAYGAVCTPDPFLFDKDLKLVYHGRLDNALSPDQIPTRHDMNATIKALLSDEKINNTFLPSRGCSIKWKHRLI